MAETDDIDRLLRTCVDAYREVSTPDPARTAAALERVQAKLGNIGSQSFGTGKAAWGKSVGAAAKLGLAVALAGAVTVAIIASSGDGEPQANRPKVAPTLQDPAPMSFDAPVPTTRSTTESRIERAAPAIAPNAAEIRSHVRARRAREPDHPDPSVPRGADQSATTPPEQATQPRKHSLAAELALFEQARTALRSGRPAQALSLVQTHARQYPRSPFAEERSATELLALCALGRSEQARSLARRFRSEYPESAFAARLTEDCPGG